jgi:hypothetical protein
MAPSQVVDLSAAASGSAALGAASITVAGDGTIYLLAGGYDSSGGDWPWPYETKLFKTDSTRLSSGNLGTALPPLTSSEGSSWLVRWDENDSTLWVGAGTKIEARDADGSLLESFTPAQLGDNAYSIAVIDTDAVDDDNNNGGSNGGGCNAGQSLLMILPAAFILYKRNRRG